MSDDVLKTTDLDDYYFWQSMAAAITDRDRELAKQFLDMPPSDDDRENLATIICIARHEEAARAKR